MKVYVGPYPKHRWYHHYLYKWFGYSADQIKYIKIDRWDSWSADYTLAEIILPVLVQLKNDHQGAPFVDPDDVPEYLKPSHMLEDDNVDNTHFERWEWVLDEMIFAFSSKVEKDWEEQYRGPFISDESGSIMGGHFEWVDNEGRKAHQERMSNGFRLFGKYYENLWN